MLVWPREQKQPSMKKKTGKDTNLIHFIFGTSHLSQHLFFLLPITTPKCLKEKKKTVVIFIGLKVFQRLIFYFLLTLSWMWKKQCLTQKEIARKGFQTLESSLKTCRGDLVSGMSRMVDITDKPVCLPFYECTWLELEFGPKVTV